MHGRSLRPLVFTLLTAVAAAACTAPPAGPPAPGAPPPAEKPSPLPGVTKSLDELKAEMFHVGAGRRLKPAQWPGGNRVAVALSFDVDNATMALPVRWMEIHNEPPSIFRSKVNVA